jgi:hypothetical protein
MSSQDVTVMESSTDALEHEPDETIPVPTIDVHSWLKSSDEKVQSLEKGVGHLDQRVVHLDSRVSGLEKTSAANENTTNTASVSTKEPDESNTESADSFNVYDFM